MQLIMYVGNDHIESIPLNKTKISIPGYLGNIKRQLKEKHSDLLMETGASAEFLIVNLQSGEREASGETSH